MIALTVEEILKAIGGTLIVPDNGDRGEVLKRTVSGASFDSRETEPGFAFFALKGERSDGHDYIPKIFDKLSCAVTEREVDCPVPQIIVPSTYSAVGALGAYIREKSGVKVVGITGSVGKTSVKELTACVLGRKYSVLKTEGNYNNELGLPRMLFRLTPENDIAVLEMGISHFGEMTRLSSIAKPDTAIYTNIETVHTENLIDRGGVLAAKTELVANMNGDTLILNGDDDMLRGYRLPEGKRAVYYGTGDGCSVTAKDIVLRGLEYSAFELLTPNGSVHVELPALGRHMVTNALAAAACGLEYGVSLEDIKLGLESFVPVGRRMRRLTYNSAVVLDDCYNASPVSMEASLRVLCGLGGRRIALLGDMLELGPSSHELHRHIGKIASELGLDILITVGKEADCIAAAAEQGGVNTVLRTDSEEAPDLLKSILGPGDTLLIKASHGMHFDRIVEGLN